jgi:hypothetical protein
VLGVVVAEDSWSAASAAAARWPTVTAAAAKSLVDVWFNALMGQSSEQRAATAVMAAAAAAAVRSPGVHTLLLLSDIISYCYHQLA